jgi:hypothetical protein
MGPMSDDVYPCPCCGHLVFEEPPGSDDICMICFWEDDVTQLRWPWLAGATNAVSLVEAQRNVIRLGASEERFVGDVRPATPTEPIDEGWRPITDQDRFEKPEDTAAWPEDRTRLYYWRPTFWRIAPLLS